MIGQGVVADDSPQLVGAARSTALAGADTVLLLGARLNWMLHFGQPPRWAHGQTQTDTVDIHNSTSAVDTHWHFCLIWRQNSPE